MPETLTREALEDYARQIKEGSLTCRARDSFDIGAISVEQYQEAITNLRKNEDTLRAQRRREAAIAEAIDHPPPVLDFAKARPVHIGDALEAIRRVREEEDMDVDAIITHPDTPIGIAEDDGHPGSSWEIPRELLRVRLGNGVCHEAFRRHQDAVGEAIAEALPEEGGFGVVSRLFNLNEPWTPGSLVFAGPMMISVAFRPVLEEGMGALFRGNRGYRSFRKVTDEAEKKAWALLEKFMTPDQYFAFMEGSTIELENGDGRYRLLIGRTGEFSLLQGKSGAGIKVIGGIIRRYKYPLGDEIAAFLDWFNHRTDKLIAQWNCGTFSMVKEGR